MGAKEEGLKNTIITNRTLEFQSLLDIYTAEQLTMLENATQTATNDILAYIESKGDDLSEFAEVRTSQLLDELNSVTEATQAQITGSIADMSGEAGASTLTSTNSVLSFDGAVSGFSTVSLSSAQYASLMANTPVGGTLLADWVSETFTTNAINAVQQEIITSLQLGESYSAIVTRLESTVTGLTTNELTMLARTYVQSANVGAMQSVYSANSDIVKKVRWSSTLEVGVGRSGAGGGATCIRCFVLDGQEYKINEAPDCPLHPYCRCYLLPVTATWEELGLTGAKEIETAYKPYTVRETSAIGTGGTRKIYDTGFAQDSKDMYSQMSTGSQVDILGPTRQSMLSSGKYTMDDLVNLQTGELYTIEQMTGETWQAVLKGNK